MIALSRRHHAGEPRMFKELNKIGRIVSDIGQPVTIAGYSDPTAPGRGVSNQELSIRRAFWCVTTWSMRLELIQRSSLSKDEAWK